MVRSVFAKWSHRNPQQLLMFQRDGLLINLGCGENTMQGWINIDYQWNPKLEICWDITRVLPIPSNAFSGVFSEHCLEHFSRDQALQILNETFRILSPGGVVRIAVPDVETYIDAYNADRCGEEG